VIAISQESLPETRARASTGTTALVDQREACIPYVGLLALIVGWLWLLPLRGGFWLDETQTAWIIQQGFAGVFARCMQLKTQAPGYFVVAWLASKIAGPSEIALRLPSTVAIGIATYLVFRLAVRVVGPRAAWASAIVFACAGPVAFAATDARPYGMGLMAVVAAIFFLVRWLDTGHWMPLIGYCVFTGISVQMHYVFGLTLLVHVIYATYRILTEKRIAISQLAGGLALLCVMLLPALFEVLAMLRAPKSYSFWGSAEFADLFATVAPSALFGSAISALLLVYAVWPHLKFRPDRLDRSSFVLLASTFLVPGVVLLGMARKVSLQVFLPRYLLPYEIGLALLAGWVLSGMQSRRFRILALSAIVFGAIMCTTGIKPPHHNGGDWRAAMAAERSAVGNTTIPVLIRSGFVESSPFDWQNDDQRRAALFTPLSVYPASGNVIYLPSILSPAAVAYMNQVSQSQLEQSGRFLFVNQGDISYENWLLGRFSSEGFTSRQVGRFGGTLKVILFCRPSGEQPCKSAS